MFYVLFTYSKGRKERDFRGFRSEDELIEFLHKNYEKIDIVQIIGVEKSYRLGLVETSEVVKSILVSQELKVELSGHRDPLPPIEEKTGTEKIAGGIEKEQEEDKNISLGPEAGKALSDEEIIKKNKIALEKADEAIAAAKADIKKTGNKFDKSKWEDCPICHKEKVAPWSKKKIGSICQRNKKKLKKEEQGI